MWIMDALHMVRQAYIRTRYIMIYTRQTQKLVEWLYKRIQYTNKGDIHSYGV